VASAKAVNIHDAKTQFSKLLRRVAAGEEITIANRGTPVARLVPPAEEKPIRELGKDRGKVWIADDFDAPLPDEVLALFYGTTDLPKPIKSPKAKKR
jgi:prevent-host-death family protein